MASRAAKIVLPIVVFIAGVLFVVIVIAMLKKPEPKEITVEPPLVNVVTARAITPALDVTINGVVKASAETALAAQVGGKVVKISDSMVDGGFFAKDEELVTIEPADTDLAVRDAESRASAAAAKKLAAEADVARLTAQRTVAEHQTEASRQEAAMADADVTSAKAGVKSAESALLASDAGVARASAGVATAQSALATEQALSKLAEEEWRKFGGQGEPSDLVLRKPQLKQAECNLIAAREDVKSAENMRDSAGAALIGAHAKLDGATLRAKAAREAILAAEAGLVARDSQKDAAAAMVTAAGSEVDAAAAGKDRAALDKGRTVIRAPYAGRVRSRHVGLGQQLMPGAVVANIYATDYVEIPLPVPVGQLEYLELPYFEAARTEKAAGTAATGANTPGSVKVFVEFAGKKHVWSGYIHRTAAEVNPATRVLEVVVRVNDPYGAQHKEADLPLLLGSFVTAVLPGRNAGAVYRISRTALRDHAPDAAAAKQPALDGLSSWVVIAGPEVQSDSVKLEPGNTNRGAPVNPTLKAGDHELARLSYRRVKVLRYEGRDALISAGLKDGDRVALTALDVITEGMLARLAKPEEAAARTAPSTATPSGGSAK